MRNRILGGIGVLWGGAIVLNRLLGGSGGAAGSAAYNAGATVALVFGFVLLAVGAYYLFKPQR
jgi:hypothetical protein